MIESRLKSLFPEIQISVLWQDNDCPFKIKLGQLSALNYQLLFTDGLSANDQVVKSGFEAFKKIELYFLLPDYFDLNKDNWPILWLKKLAELPKKNNTWFGPGDTIPAGNPPQILSDNFAANHFMIVEPILAKPIFNHEIWAAEGIHFFGIVPICQAELEYKIRNSATVLLTRLKHKNHTEKVDFFRTAVCNICCN